MSAALDAAALALIAEQTPKPRRWKPLRDLILVERLDMGRERTTKGGIVLPATLGSKIKTKADVWRGKVLAIGPEVTELSVGEHVLVYTWNDDTGKQGLYTGIGLGAHRLLIRPDDIICAVHPDAEVDVAQSRGTGK